MGAYSVMSECEVSLIIPLSNMNTQQEEEELLYFILSPNEPTCFSAVIVSYVSSRWYFLYLHEAHKYKIHRHHSEGNL